MFKLFSVFAIIKGNDSVECLYIDLFMNDGFLKIDYKKQN